MNTSKETRQMVFASLLAALTAAGAYLIIPVGPVPISLQTLFIYLTGLLLGSRWGTASICIYLLAGILGLPVFSGGTGGIGRIIGPTGGYLIGFLPAVFFIGLISDKNKSSILIDIFSMIAGTAIIYACGVSWLKVVTGMSLSKAVSVGVIPFLPGDALKIAASIPIVKSLGPLVRPESSPILTDEHH